MADIISPNYAGNRKFGAYLNQYGATSGRVPSSNMLDQIVQSELDAAYNNMWRGKQLQLERDRFTEGKRQFDVGQQNAMDTAEANREASLWGAGINTAGTILGTGLGAYKALGGTGLDLLSKGATGLGTKAATEGVMSQADFLGLGPATSAMGGGGFDAAMGASALSSATELGAMGLEGFDVAMGANALSSAAELGAMGSGATSAGWLSALGPAALAVGGPLAIYGLLGGFEGEDQEAVMRANVAEMSKYKPEEWANKAIEGDIARQKAEAANPMFVGSSAFMPAGGVGAPVDLAERWKYYYNDYFNTLGRYGYNVPQAIPANDAYSQYAQSISGRTMGGPVQANMPYMVGERGPEMIVPQQSGMVIPNKLLSSVADWYGE